MAGMIPGLLPDYSQDDDDLRNDRRLQSLAAQDPFTAAAYTAYSGSRLAGQGLAHAVGGALGVDTRSPAQKQRENIEAVKATMAGSNLQPNSPEYYEKLAAEFNRLGMVDSAAMASRALEELKRQRAQTAAYERQNQPKPASAKDRLTDLYWQTVEGLAGNPNDAALAAKKAALEKALGIHDQQPSADWTLVQPTQYSPGYMYNRRTGERRTIEGRIAKPGEAGGEIDSPFADLPPEAKKAAERQAGKDVAEWVGGGRATALRGIEALRDVQARLESDPDLVNDPISSSLPDSMRAMTAGGRAAIQARETVRSAVQATLRQIMGPQFTEKEGTQMFERAYDTRLGPKENIERLERAIVELEEKIQAKDALARGKRPAERTPRDPRTVRVRLPDGRTGRIPRASLPAAKARGAVEAE